MSEHQPRPSRVFHIAPKLSYTDLGIPRDAKGKQLSSALSSHSVSATVMQNVYLNASELQAGVPFGDIERSDDFVSIHHGQRLTGQHAIRRSFGSTLASVAFGAEWNLDRPEIVYMSGYVYQLAYQQAATYVAAQIERRKLTVAPTAEVENAKQAAIAEMEKRRANYNTFALRLRESLTEYAQQKLPPNSQYLEVLQALTNLARDPQSNKIKHVWDSKLGAQHPLYEALKQQDEQGVVSEEGIRQAHTLLYPSS